MNRDKMKVIIISVLQTMCHGQPDARIIDMDQP